MTIRLGTVNYWLPRPEFYDLDSDPGESYKVADLHADIVGSITEDVVAQIQTMPPETQETFAKLQKNVASRSTPIAATPRPPRI